MIMILILPNNKQIYKIKIILFMKIKHKKIINKNKIYFNKKYLWT